MENKTKDLTKVGFGIAVMFLVSWIYGFFIAGHLPISNLLKSIILLVVLYTIGLGLFIYITKDVTENVYKKGKLSFKTYLTCFLLQFCALFLTMLINVVLIVVLKANPTGTDSLSLPVLLSLLVVAPIFEELVFRHIFAKKLLKYGEAFFVLVSAFCFCVVHGVSAGIPTIIYTFILGLIWSYLLVKTGNIWMPIFYHSISNFFGSILAQMIFAFSEKLFPIYLIMIIVFAVAGLIMFIRNKKDFSFEDKVFSKDNLKQLFTNKGIIFLILATISFMLIKNVI